MALTPFESHPKDQKWKADKKLSKQIDDKIKEGKLVVGNPSSEITTRQMTEEERKKYFS